MPSRCWTAAKSTCCIYPSYKRCLPTVFFVFCFETGFLSPLFFTQCSILYTRCKEPLLCWGRVTRRIFSLDSRTLNKISIASAFPLPTSKAIVNKIHLSVKPYRIFLNFISKLKREIKTFKIYSEVCSISKGFLRGPLSGRSNPAGRSL